MEKTAAIFFVCLALTVTGCWWAWAYQRAAAYERGYEERRVITTTTTSVDQGTVWVKRDAPSGFEVEAKK